jgi:hypothetical protein
MKLEESPLEDGIIIARDLYIDNDYYNDGINVPLPQCVIICFTMEV